MQPLAPTPDVARVAKIELGQSQSSVETIMQRPGRKIAYPLRPEAPVEIWRYEDHFTSRCLFVTYDTNDRVTDIATFERERDERGKLGTRLSGSC